MRKLLNFPLINLVSRTLGWIFTCTTNPSNTGMLLQMELQHFTWRSGSQRAGGEHGEQSCRYMLQSKHLVKVQMCFFLLNEWLSHTVCNGFSTKKTPDRKRVCVVLHASTISTPRLCINVLCFYHYRNIFPLLHHYFVFCRMINQPSILYSRNNKWFRVWEMLLTLI